MSFEGTFAHSLMAGSTDTRILQDITHKNSGKSFEENAFRFQSLFNEMTAGGHFKVLMMADLERLYYSGFNKAR